MKKTNLKKAYLILRTCALCGSVFLLVLIEIVSLTPYCNDMKLIIPGYRFFLSPCSNSIKNLTDDIEAEATEQKTRRRTNSLFNVHS